MTSLQIRIIDKELLEQIKVKKCDSILRGHGLLLQETQMLRFKLAAVHSKFDILISCQYNVFSSQ